MAQLIRPLRQWSRLQQHCCFGATFNDLLFSPLIAVKTSFKPLSITNVPNSHRSVHTKPSALKPKDAPVPSDFKEGNTTDSESDEKRSRNERKREARRAVRWAMELATFSIPQIKRIHRVASLEPEVLGALMLVKRLGHDVREGKRRQFNYIGKLLRNVDPELMNALILSTKDGDQSRLQALSGSVVFDDVDGESEESENEDEEEEEGEHIITATRWFDGLINKDVNITNEVYSIHDVDFDRQELRKLVRKVHSIQDRQDTEEEEKKLDAANRSLTRFLRGLARQMSSE